MAGGGERGAEGLAMKGQTDFYVWGSPEFHGHCFLNLRWLFFKGLCSVSYPLIAFEKDYLRCS